MCSYLDNEPRNGLRHIKLPVHWIEGGWPTSVLWVVLVIDLFANGTIGCTAAAVAQYRNSSS